MLAQRRRRWANIESALVQLLALAGKVLGFIMNDNFFVVLKEVVGFYQVKKNVIASVYPDAASRTVLVISLTQSHKIFPSIIDSCDTPPPPHTQFHWDYITLCNESSQQHREGLVWIASLKILYKSEKTSNFYDAKCPQAVCIYQDHYNYIDKEFCSVT